jgi:hypothetical protein
VPKSFAEDGRRMTEHQLLLLALLGLLLPILYYWDGGPGRPLQPAPAPRLVVLALSRLQVSPCLIMTLLWTICLFDGDSLADFLTSLQFACLIQTPFFRLSVFIRTP